MNELAIKAKNAVSLSKKCWLITTPNGEDYFPSLLLQQKGEKARIAILDNDQEDISHNKLREILSDEPTQSDDSFDVRASDLQDLIALETEAVLQKLAALFSQFHNISSEDILSMIRTLRNSYPLESIMTTLEALTSQEIEELLDSEDYLATYNEILNSSDDYSEEFSY